MKRILLLAILSSCLMSCGTPETALRATTQPNPTNVPATPGPSPTAAPLSAYPYPAPDRRPSRLPPLPANVLDVLR